MPPLISLFCNFVLMSLKSDAVLRSIIPVWLLMASSWVTKEDPRVPVSLFTSAIGVSLMELPVGEDEPDHHHHEQRHEHQHDET